MARAGSVDLALVAVAAEYLMPLTARQGLEHMRLYKPEVYMPAHHDAPIGGRRSAHRDARSEEHTSELQSHLNLVCRLLLEKKKKKYYIEYIEHSSTHT